MEPKNVTLCISYSGSRWCKLEVFENDDPRLSRFLTSLRRVCDNMERTITSEGEIFSYTGLGNVKNSLEIQNKNIIPLTNKVWEKYEFKPDYKGFIIVKQENNKIPKLVKVGYEKLAYAKEAISKAIVHARNVHKDLKTSRNDFTAKLQYTDKDGQQNTVKYQIYIIE